MDDFIAAVEKLREDYPDIKWILAAVKDNGDSEDSALGRSMNMIMTDVILLIGLWIRGYGLSLKNIQDGIDIQKGIDVSEGTGGIHFNLN